MNQGALVRITHIGPYNGTDPVGAVLETVGKVGVVDRRDGERYVVVVPGYNSFGDLHSEYVYCGKELEVVGAVEEVMG